MRLAREPPSARAHSSAKQANCGSRQCQRLPLIRLKATKVTPEVSSSSREPLSSSRPRFNPCHQRGQSSQGASITGSHAT